MNDQSIKDLEDTLHAGEREVLDAGTLATIRREGGRRRTARRSLMAVGTAAVVAAVGLTLALVSPGDDGRTRDDSVQVADPPRKELGPLAQRALAEIPGAVQVSDWQVVLPYPGVESDYWGDDSADFEVSGDLLPLGVRSYQGVTMFPAEGWPAWLYEGTLAFEQSLKDEDGSYPVGSTDNGILVDTGEALLTCMSANDRPCGPAVMTRTPDGELHYEWGMGTEEFLKPGADMEVFLDEDYSTGSPGELAIAGLPGTDVARVEFVTKAGEVVEGQVSTTLVEGSSMMWARVSGELAKVVAYDADGGVIEDHPLRHCDSPVDCEVR